MIFSRLLDETCQGFGTSMKRERKRGWGEEGGSMVGNLIHSFARDGIRDHYQRCLVLSMHRHTAVQDFDM